MSHQQNQQNNQIIIKVVEFDTLDKVLSEVVIPFSELMHRDANNDIYKGYEKIPFCIRDPSYKAILLKEFESAMHEYERSNLKE